MLDAEVPDMRTIVACSSPVFAMLLAAPLSGQALAQPRDPDAGRATAERWCAACHVVSSGQPVGPDAGPPFSELAANPDWSDVERLRLFLARPHRLMPEFVVTRREAADLSAFLSTQRR